MKNINWDVRFMRLADLIATWSKDEGTGAIICTQENQIISTGYNGQVSGIKEVDYCYQEPLKNFYIEHAERNAIYNAAKLGLPLKGTKIYINRFPCADCARAICQTGITDIICSAPYKSKKYKTHFKIAKEIIKNKKINLTLL